MWSWSQSLPAVSEDTLTAQLLFIHHVWQQLSWRLDKKRSWIIIYLLFIFLQVQSSCNCRRYVFSCPFIGFNLVNAMCHEHREGGLLHLALTSGAAQRTDSSEFGGQRSKSLRPHKVTQEFSDDVLIKSLTEEEEEQSSLWELSGSLILLSVILQHHITSYSRLHHPAITSHPPA